MKKKANKTKQSSSGKIFKQCSGCNKKWANREEMLTDPEICLIGYQAHFEDLALGLFLFNHSCKSTFSVLAGEFADMYKGPVFDKRLTGSESCPGYCLHEESLDPCSLECECAYVREIVQLLKKKHLP